MRRPLVVMLLTAAALACAPSAHAADPDLWATVNMCDTQIAPNAMGVRASMPGNGTKQRMYMRFHATWFSRLRQAWYPVDGKGNSPWILAGDATKRARQAGYTFFFSAPAKGSTFVVRAEVEFQWRTRKRVRTARKGRTVRWVVTRRARATTRHGVPNVGAGDPPGTSEGLCVIS